MTEPAAPSAGPITGDPWHHPDPHVSRLRLVAVPVPVVDALARGEGLGQAVGTLAVTPYLAGEECRGLWRMRSRQLAETPTDAPWVTRLVVVADGPGDVPVGLGGFHGAPDGRGMVEIGYRIDPAHRRRGHARRALETLLAVARAHPDVRVVRATVGPHNHASRSLVAAYGLVEVGEQWDDEDGLEVVLEVAVDGVQASGSV